MSSKQCDETQDFGGESLAINIEKATRQNTNYRTALWTGEHLQVTLMSIYAGEDIGLEIHPNLDQFIRIQSGVACVQMGRTKDNLTYKQKVDCSYAVFIPAGTWHNIINIGNAPVKLYSVYAPPQHPFDTVEKIKPEE